MRKTVQVFIKDGGQSGWVERLSDHSSISFIIGSKFYKKELPKTKKQLLEKGNLRWDESPTQYMAKAAVDALFDYHQKGFKGDKKFRK